MANARDSVLPCRRDGMVACNAVERRKNTAEFDGRQFILNEWFGQANCFSSSDPCGQNSQGHVLK